MKKIMKSMLLPAVVGFMPIAVFAADYNLNFQSVFYDTEKSFEFQQEWADKVEKDSNGRLHIDLVPDGSIVDWNETVDGMRLGVLDGHISLSSFFADKEPALGLITNAVGAWSDTSQLSKYMYEGGGNALLEKLYAKHGVQLIGTFNEELESFVSKKAINKVADFKGVKVRVPDSLTFAVFSTLGAQPVSLSASQVPQAVGKGTVDAADASFFFVNQSEGLNDIAPNPIYPGFHTLPAIDISMSKEKWDSLPKDLQDLLKKSVKTFDNEVTKTIKELDKQAIEVAKKNPKIKIHSWSDAERKKFRDIAQEQWKIVSEKSPDAKLVYDSLMKFMRDNNLL